MALNLENKSAIIDLHSAQNDEPNLCENLEFWMTGLPSRLKSFPVIYLSIPGSHNSMTYTIERNNDVGPDEPFAIRTMGRYFSCFTVPIIFNWSINQKNNIKEQLNGGIRYLDLRVSTKNNDDKIYFLHGLYGAEVSQPLQDIADWLSEHPNEVLIIDFQHFYNFNEENHRNLIDKVKYLFRGKMCPVHNTLGRLTLNWLNSKKYQIFIIYRNIIARNYSHLWPSSLWPTPWPNTVNTDKLINFLNNGLKTRVKDAAFVSQCLLTPNISFVVKHICGNLERNINVECRQVILPWIAKNSPGNGGMNIVITDYVSIDNFQFSKNVIQRNLILLQSYTSELQIKI